MSVAFASARPRGKGEVTQQTIQKVKRRAVLRGVPWFRPRRGGPGWVREGRGDGRGGAEVEQSGGVRIAARAGGGAGDGIGVARWLCRSQGGRSCEGCAGKWQWDLQTCDWFLVACQLPGPPQIQPQKWIKIKIPNLHRFSFVCGRRMLIPRKVEGAPAPGVVPHRYRCDCSSRVHWWSVTDKGLTGFRSPRGSRGRPTPRAPDWEVVVPRLAGPDSRDRALPPQVTVGKEEAGSGRRDPARSYLARCRRCCAAAGAVGPAPLRSGGRGSGAGAVWRWTGHRRVCSRADAWCQLVTSRENSLGGRRWQNRGEGSANCSKRDWRDDWNRGRLFG